MGEKASRRSLSIGVGLALGTTAVSGAILLGAGASWPQWLGIASLPLLLEGVLLAVLAYRGPRVPRSRLWQLTLHDVYIFEEGWRQQQTFPSGKLSRRPLRMAVPPLILGAILFVVSAVA